MSSPRQNETEREEAERREREEMFSFHPDILAEASPLPRKSDGSSFQPPVGETDATHEP